MKPIPGFALGRLGYSKGLQFMDQLLGLQKVKGDKDCLLLCEHNPVYTVGIRDTSYTPKDEQRLKNLGAEFHRIRRGGLITFHGPGQLVVYPILNLRNFGRSGNPVRWYVCRLEHVVIKVCSELGLTAARSELNPGVWVGKKKVCAVGIRVSAGVTSHGIALNCNTDLDWYRHIVPCGITDPTAGVTSLTEVLGSDCTMERVMPLFLKSFSEVFKVPIVAVPGSEVDEFIGNEI